MIRVLKQTFGGVLRELLEVVLEQEEYDWAARMGFARHREALINKNVRADGTKTTWDEDINGAIGEYVASVGLEKEWNIPGGVGQPDLVGGIEVRTVMSEDRKLLIKPKDKDDSPFVLVIGTDKHLVWRMPGWLRGGDGKKATFKDRLLPIYLVDQQYLNPILELKE
jgi:hypothetical protein